MQLWSTNAGWRTVHAYLGVLVNRMLAQARINTMLTEQQRTMLLQEAQGLAAVRAQIKVEGRALEDFLDDTIAPVRAEAFVWDYLCDEANGDVWRTCGMSRGQAALAAAGKTREDIFDTTRLSEVTKVGRMATVTVTRKAGEEVGKLDQLEEAPRLAQACGHAATGLETVARKLERPAGELVVAQSRQRRRAGDIADAQRVALPRLHGRLVQVLPKPFVEALFPQVERGTVVEGGDDGTDGGDTPA